MAARVVLDEAAIRRLTNSSSGAIAQDLLRRGRNVEATAKSLCGVDTGRLRSSIHTKLSSSGGDLVCLIGTNVDYGLYHHEGVGLFGPRGRPIRPVRARMLSWQPRGGPRVFARQSRGYPGTHYLLNALESARR